MRLKVSRMEKDNYKVEHGDKVVFRGSRIDLKSHLMSNYGVKEIKLVKPTQEIVATDYKKLIAINNKIKEVCISKAEHFDFSIPQLNRVKFSFSDRQIGEVDASCCYDNLEIVIMPSACGETPLNDYKYIVVKEFIKIMAHLCYGSDKDLYVDRLYRLFEINK